MGCEVQSAAEKHMCRGHQGWQSFAFERAIAKITPSPSVNCGPMATNKVGGDGGRS